MVGDKLDDSKNRGPLALLLLIPFATLWYMATALDHEFVDGKAHFFIFFSYLVKRRNTVERDCENSSVVVPARQPTVR